MKDSCRRGGPIYPNPYLPASDSRFSPVDSIEVLTLPYNACQRRRASPLIVAAVDDLTLPYHDRRRVVQHIWSPQAVLQPQRRLWMLGHAFLLLGVFMLVTVGGVWADAQLTFAQVDPLGTPYHIHTIVGIRRAHRERASGPRSSLRICI